VFDRLRSIQLRYHAGARESWRVFPRLRPLESGPYPRFACAVASDLRACGIGFRGSSCGGFVSGVIVKSSAYSVWIHGLNPLLSFPSRRRSGDGAHVHEAVQPALRQEGDEDPHGRSRCSW
jgi:hypothetical protein